MSDTSTLRDVPEPVQRAFASMLRNMQEAELARIEADPEAHRDTTLMGDDGLRYRYYSTDCGHTRYCYATTKNAAGYWLTWREVEDSKGNGRRLNIRGHKRRKDAKESALKGWENHGK